MLAIAPLAFSQVGVFTGEATVGDDGGAGQASFSGGVYTIDGSGNDIWNQSDGFYWVYKEVTGSFSATVSLAWNEAGAIRGAAVNDWRKMGFMVRPEPDNIAGMHVAAILNNALNADLAWRDANNTNAADAGENGKTANDTDTIRLVRVFNNFSLLRKQTDGSFRTIASHTVDMPDKVLLGLAVTAHDVSNIESAKFSGLQIDPIATAVEATRTVPQPTYTGGSLISGFVIDVTVETGKTADLTISEVLPEGWTLASSTPTGTVANGVVTWTLAGASGKKQIKYNLKAASGMGLEGVLFSGSVVAAGTTFGIGGNAGMDLEGADRAYAPFLSGKSTTLDGELKAGEYDGSYVFTFDRTNDRAPGVLLAGASFAHDKSNLTVHVFHNAGFINVGLDMIDPSVSFSSHATDAWQNDSCELYMDGDNSRKATKDGNQFGFQATVTGNGSLIGGNDAPGTAVDTANGGRASTDGLYWNWGAKPKADGSGFVIEYQVEKAMILEPLDVDHIGFDIGVNDVNQGDTGRTGKWAWWHFDADTGKRKDAWDDERGWGILELLKTAQLPGVPDWALY